MPAYPPSCAKPPFWSASGRLRWWRRPRRFAHSAVPRRSGGRALQWSFRRPSAARAGASLPSIGARSRARRGTLSSSSVCTAVFARAGLWPRCAACKACRSVVAPPARHCSALTLARWWRSCSCAAALPLANAAAGGHARATTQRGAGAEVAAAATLAGPAGALARARARAHTPCLCPPAARQRRFSQLLNAAGLPLSSLDLSPVHLMRQVGQDFMHWLEVMRVGARVRLRGHSPLRVRPLTLLACHPP